ncbi:AAEL008835-PA [Aedes aegypti]|uniref:AAEL008835-PA n=1 Tax=Aedes aegypti TaxID=7159 RepID=Q16XL1_AEDAE|nr:AAEL008835-PA [Aedes aegypti]
MDFSRKRKRHPNANKMHTLVKKKHINNCPDIPRSVGNLSQQYFLLARHLQQQTFISETIPLINQSTIQEYSDYVPITHLEEQRLRVNSVCQINNGLCKVDFTELLKRKLAEMNSETPSKPAIDHTIASNEVTYRIDFDRLIRERLNECHQAPPPPVAVAGNRPAEPKFSIFHNVELMAQSSRGSSTC